MSSKSSPIAKHSSSTPPSSVSLDIDDDIWGADSPLRQASPSLDDASQRHDVLSDAPLVRRQQLTAGYREGVSIGKAQTMQDGFDQGYPLGAEIGLRVGYIKGVLEGIALSLVKTEANETVQKLRAETKNILQKLHVQEFLKGVEDKIVAAEEEARQVQTVEQTPLHEADSITQHSDSRVKDGDRSLFDKSALEYLSTLESAVESLLENVQRHTQAAR
ncbi:MAG: hypothetical protein Q9160_003872 [Pyrenula sp. 1 TL-2023]